MSPTNHHRIIEKKETILSLWEERCVKEVKSARETGSRALRDSLPLYLDHLDEALTANHKMVAREAAILDREATRIGKMHGADRALNTRYTLSEVVEEYHILREVLFHVLELDGPLSELNRDIVLDSIDQAVKNAVVEFTGAHAETQQKFIHTLTHDLRTPISVAKMNAHLAMKCAGLPTPAIDCIKKNVISLNRLDSMIQNLLDVSRIRAGESLTLQFERCDLEAVIREVVDEMTIVHRARFLLKSNGPLVGNWGRDALTRAVENLIDNAVKYGADGTPITVSVKDSGLNVEICVHNEGSFIPESEIPRMFEKFQRSQSAQEETQPGWGLGLTLVQAVVEDHQGRIRVHSSEDAGTTFVLELPRSGAPHTGSPSTSSV